MNSKSILIVVSLVSLLGCKSNYFVSNEKITSHWVFSRGFELSEITVDSTNKKGIPIKYSKNNIFVCLVSKENAISSDVTSNFFREIDDYWQYQDKLDSLNIDFPTTINSKSIFFHREQKMVKWVQFPFLNNSPTSILPVHFKPNEWYKLSHFNPAYEQLDYSIFFYLNHSGKLKCYHVYEE